MTSAEGSMPTNGRWDRYKDHEGREFTRTSTLIKKVETDDYNLRLWAKRQVLVGASLRDDLIMGAKAMKPHPVTGWSTAQKKDLNALVAKAEEAAKSTDGAILGTAVHTLTERLDRGEDIESVVTGLPAQAERDLRAYAKLIELNGWRHVEIERTVVNDEIDVAGTFDRVTLIPGLTDLLGRGYCQHGCGVGGEGAGNHERDDLDVVILDVKTEGDPARNGLHIGPQLATYSRATRMWLPTPRYVDTPCVRQDVAVVVHVRDGHATPYFVNLIEGWETAKAARVQYEREKQARMWLAPMPGIKEPRPAEVIVESSANTTGTWPLVMPPLPGTAPWHVAVNEACANCASLVASATRVDGTEADFVCRDCGRTAIPASGIDMTTGAAASPTQVAVEVAPGVVAWQPEPVARGVLDDVDRQAIEAIWAAPDVEHLQRTAEIYTTKLGRTMGGRVQEAAAARWQQVTCVQRALHGGAGSAKCACGWVAGILP
ncbi:MAG: hypothetical protein ABWY81_06110 [Jiangellaceae bacterium]